MFFLRRGQDFACNARMNTIVSKVQKPSERSRKPISARTRSAMMASIRSRDTTPELVVRRCVRGLGFRYRLHARTLPGKPDLVFRRLKKVIFVNGCFWHQHDGCSLASVPKARPEYWLPKLARNRLRDVLNEAALIDAGWSVLVIWECETNSDALLREKLLRFLNSVDCRP